MNFQKLVIVVALIVMLFMLTVIGYLLATNKSAKLFPPVSSQCPDYWISKDNECTNPKNLGNSTPGCKGPKNFINNNFKGHNGDCLKAKWANSCGLTWQGLTTNPKVCNSNTPAPTNFL